MEPTPKVRVVVVDDDQVILAAIAESAEKCGKFEVVTFSEPLKANEYLKNNEHVVDVFVADEEMPGMSGTALLVSVKKAFPKMKCVLISQYPRDTKPDCADVFIEKKTPTAEFLHSMKKLLLNIVREPG